MSAVVLLLTFSLVLFALRGGAVTVLGVLLGTVLLLPATLLVPGTPTDLLTVPRAVEGAALLGFVLRGRRQPALHSAARAPVVLVLLCVYLGIVAVTGVALADASVDPVAASYAWVGQAEQVVTLALVLGLARRIPSRVVLQLLTAAAAAVLTVCLVEAVTGDSFARLLFRASPEQLGSGPASALERRSGQLRVRGAADFALAAGWVLAALLPAVCVMFRSLLGRRRYFEALAVGALAPALVGGVALTRARSPLVAAVVVVALLVVALTPRRPAALLTSAGLLVGVASALAPSLAARLAPKVDSGSIDVRLERLPDVLALAAPHPIRGFGLTGVEHVGLAGVDSSYLQVYVESGALAITILALALVVAVSSVLRGLRSRRSSAGTPDDQLLILACGLSLIALVASGFIFDIFNELGTGRLFWLLCGVGVAAAERAGAVPARRDPWVLASPVRWGVVMGAVAVGLLIRAAVPTHAASEVVFATLPVDTEVESDPPGYGRTLVVTTCQLAERAVLDTDADVTVCSEQGPPGWGRIRVEAKDPLTAASALRAVISSTGAVSALRHLRVAEVAPGPVVGSPSAAAVAPHVLGLAAVSALLLVPRRRPRDSRRGRTSGDEVASGAVAS